ncbi:hypothetical protein [Sorangium sp. So ce887]|uniref:hypothetical protein n=1 Tax=Sorangium sp. So ce887 TaxID=3133324 RepID=UPI003F5FD86B
MLCHHRHSSTSPEAGYRAATSGAPLTGGARRRALALLSTLAALTALAPAARAAEPTREERAAAVALFDEGRALMAAGKHAEACPKLAESHQIDPGIGTLFNLSDCYERIGRTATAWIGFRDVAAASLSAGQAERERVARARAAALEPRLSRLQIVVPKEAALSGLELTRDGVALGRALWGTAVPLDPGEHRVAAAAPGHEPWETKVVIDKPGVVSVTVPALERAAEPDSAAGSGATSSVTVAPPPPARPPVTAPPPPQGGSIRRPIGMVGVGLGAVGLGVGTVLGFMAKSTFDEATEGGHCDEEGRCIDQTGLDLRGDAVRTGNLGTVVFIAGAVLAVGGAVLWITAPSAPDSGTASAGGRGRAGDAPFRARVGLGPGSAWITGTF